MVKQIILILYSFCHKLFDNNYKATIGVDFEVERFDILGLPFHLQMYIMKLNLKIFTNVYMNIYV